MYNMLGRHGRPVAQGYATSLNHESLNIIRLNGKWEWERKLELMCAFIHSCRGAYEVLYLLQIVFKCECTYSIH